MSEIRTTKIDGQEFVPYKDYIRLKEEKQELEYLGDINEELKKENKKLKDEVDFWETEANKHQKERIEQHDRIINQMKKIEKLKEELRHWEEGDYYYDYFDED